MDILSNQLKRLKIKKFRVKSAGLFKLYKHSLGNRNERVDTCYRILKGINMYSGLWLITPYGQVYQILSEFQFMFTTVILKKKKKMVPSASFNFWWPSENIRR